MIRFTCPSCGRGVRVADQFAGTTGTCPACKKAVAIPLAATPARLMTLRRELPWGWILGGLLFLLFWMPLLVAWSARSDVADLRAQLREAEERARRAEDAAGKDRSAIGGELRGLRADAESLRKDLAAVREQAASLTNAATELKAQMARLASRSARAGSDEAGAEPPVLPWDKVRDLAAAQPWGQGLRQVPAAVIAVGPLRYVPYLSFRAGPQEVNVFGDPERPCGLELSVLGDSLKDSLKDQLIAFLQEALTRPELRPAAAGLRRDQGQQRRGDVTMTVTPPSPTEAAWRVAVFDEKALYLARATEEEMAAITVARTPGAAPGGAAGESPPAPWTQPELDLARAPRPAAGADPGATAAYGDRVYVRGYVRKDGTYVPRALRPPANG